MPVKNRPVKKSSANVLLLGIVSFVNDVSSEMVMPILPMFITSLGGAGLAVGVVGGLRDSVSSILKVLCGYWSDRIGNRKAFVYSGYLISLIFKVLLAFSRIWQHALFFSTCERVGKGVRTSARDAIIADSMPQMRGRGFGIHRAFDTLGAILGSLIVFLLFWFLGLGFKPIILIAALTGFGALIPLHFVKDTGCESHHSTLKASLKTLPRPLRFFILIAAVFALGNFSYMFFIIRAQQFFEGKLSVAVPLLLYVLFNVFYAAFAVPLGIASDKFGRDKLIIFGYLLFSLTSLGFVFAHSLPALVLLFSLYGITCAAIDGNQRAYVSDLASPNLRATALGVFHTMIGLMALLANLIAGFLWQNIAPRTTFICASALTFTACLVCIIHGFEPLPRRSRNQKSPPSKTHRTP